MDGPNHLTRMLESPVGRLALTGTGGALIRVAWADHESGDPVAVAGDAPLLERAATQLAAYFAGTRHRFDLSLAPEGTAFQRRVWAEMSRIPWGSTLSYGTLARRLGSAARAVGQACSANPIPIIIPCHRVLAEGGRPGGYSGGTGLATKRALLALEGVFPCAAEPGRQTGDRRSGGADSCTRTAPDLLSA